jgi:hypothetical protein
MDYRTEAPNSIQCTKLTVVYIVRDILLAVTGKVTGQSALSDPESFT